MTDISITELKIACCVRIVDDDSAMRTSYAFMLGAQGWKTSCHESAESFLASLEKDSCPGCILLDVRMPGMSGLQLHTKLNAIGCRLPVVFITGHGDVEMAVESMKMGASDFLLKPVSPDRLKRAVETYCLENYRANLAEMDSKACEENWSTLSEREREVCRLVSRGLLNKQIASELGISERTVKFHRSSAGKKLGARNTAELTALVLELDTHE